MKGAGRGGWAVGRVTMRDCFRGIRKPRNDKEFAAGMRKALGVRTATVKRLSATGESASYETSMTHDQWSGAIKRKTGDSWGMIGSSGDAFHLWAFGLSRFTGGPGVYGSGTVKGWRDRKRLAAWIAARRLSGVAPR